MKIRIECRDQEVAGGCFRVAEIEGDARSPSGMGSLLYHLCRAQPWLVRRVATVFLAKAFDVEDDDFVDGTCELMFMEFPGNTAGINDILKDELTRSLKTLEERGITHRPA